jgi:1-acyl-sn-glycerol-3-phosphate acyltransferase
MKTISKLIYKLAGWTAAGGVPEGLTKAVFVIAPHTSNLDFYIGRFYCWIKGIPINVVIKKEAFFWPFGALLKKVGGVPIDRKKSINRVDQVVELFKETDPMFFALTPEGTRKRTDKWKRGFYFIALKAKVPILLSYIDYEKKEAGVGPPFYPTGDYDKDIIEIENFYRGIKGKHPENFNL